MRVYIRVDSSAQIGMGHLMRCLTLANRLKEQNEFIAFICRNLPGSMAGLAERQGFKVYRLPALAFEGASPHPQHLQWLQASWLEDAEQTAAILAQENGSIDWLLVDSYALDQKWEKQMRAYAGRIMAIDDMANRAHDCDLLLDQNFYENAEFRYNGLISPQCRKMFGPRYALLRPEFLSARQALRERNGQIRRILISFGGSDPANETVKAMEAVRQLDRPDIALDVAVGPSNPRQEQIKALCEALPGVVCHCPAGNMAALMAGADLAIGAGGSSTWERCCLGLPSITLAIAPNQEQTSRDLTQKGVCVYLGRGDKICRDDIGIAILQLLNNPKKLLSMSRSCMSFVDGRGVIRVAETLYNN